MTPRSPIPPRPLFRAFEQLADAPGGAAKLRELILQLAVQGRLVAQDESEENDKAWRAFVKEFDSRVYGYDPGPPPPFEIPEGWRWVCLDDLGDTKPRNTVADDTAVSFVPMTLISAEYGTLVRHEQRLWGEIKKGYTHIADADVMLAKITPCFENGKAAVVRGLVNGVGAGTTELHVFRRASSVVLPEFVLLFLKSPEFVARGEPRMTGSAGQKRVPHGYFAGSPFPLPPPAEQARIVAKVDELMALCDALEARQTMRCEARRRLHAATLHHVTAARSPAELAAHWSRLRTHFDPLHASPDSIPALRQTILQLAIQGRLVAQDKEDEPAATLLTRATGGNAWKLNNTPFDLPAGWAWARLGGLGEFLGGGTPSKANSAFWEGNLPWVSPKDMKVRYISDAIDHISEAAIANSAAALIPSGSALMVVRGMILIHSFPVALTTREVAINQDMKALSLCEPAIGDYLIRALAALRDKMLAVVERSSHGTCRIESAKLKAFPIPIPPLAEQKRIVAKVEQLLALCDELETRLKDADARRERLLAASIREILSPGAILETAA